MKILGFSKDRMTALVPSAYREKRHSFVHSSASNQENFTFPSSPTQLGSSDINSSGAKELTSLGTQFRQVVLGFKLCLLI